MFTINHIFQFKKTKTEKLMIRLLNEILNNQKTIIMSGDILNQKVDQLQSAVDDEQSLLKTMVESYQKTIADLTAANADLQAQINQGATAADLQGISNRIDAIITDIKGTIPDITGSATATPAATPADPGTPAATPADPGTGGTPA